MNLVLDSDVSASQTFLASQALRQEGGGSFHHSETLQTSLGVSGSRTIWTRWTRWTL
jgi:hypothetical protein